MVYLILVKPCCKCPWLFHPAHVWTRVEEEEVGNMGGELLIEFEAGRGGHCTSFGTLSSLPPPAMRIHFVQGGEWQSNRFCHLLPWSKVLTQVNGLPFFSSSIK